MKTTSPVGYNNYSIDDYITKGRLPKESVEKIDSTNVLILPYQYDDEFYFAEESINFCKYCRENNKDYSFDILGDDVKVRSLNSFDIWMPIVYVGENILLPIAISLISDYIFSKIQGREKEDCQVDVTIKIARDGETKDIHYKGDANTFKETISKIDVDKL